MKRRQSFIDVVKRTRCRFDRHPDVRRFEEFTTFQSTKLRAVKSEHRVNGLVDAFTE